MTMKRGDVLHQVQPGGDGFGDPFERAPARVLDDVRNEKVSVQAARLPRVGSATAEVPAD